MNEIIINSVALLSGIGAVSAAVLYLVSQKFKVEENPKIDEIEAILPGVNCGACSFAGCRAFAEAVTKSNSEDFSKFFCPVGGNVVMQKVAGSLGLEAKEQEKRIAVLRCNGSKQNAPSKNIFDGMKTCKTAHLTFAGESGCPNGCLGLGDCVAVCNFDALYIDKETGLPVVVEEKCTSCGACVKKCPRNLFELRPIGKENKRVYVACMNKQKGAVAKKNCAVACIACGRCEKVYETSFVKVDNNLCYIAPEVDVENYGGLLVGCCPTGAIVGVGVTAQKPEKPAKKQVEA